MPSFHVKAGTQCFEYESKDLENMPDESRADVDPTKQQYLSTNIDSIYRTETHNNDITLIWHRDANSVVNFRLGKGECDNIPMGDPVEPHPPNSHRHQNIETLARYEEPTIKTETEALPLLRKERTVVQVDGSEVMSFKEFATRFNIFKSATGDSSRVEQQDLVEGGSSLVSVDVKIIGLWMHVKSRSALSSLALSSGYKHVSWPASHLEGTLELLLEWRTPVDNSVHQVVIASDHSIVIAVGPRDIVAHKKQNQHPTPSVPLSVSISPPSSDTSSSPRLSPHVHSVAIDPNSAHAVPQEDSHTSIAATSPPGSGDPVSDTTLTDASLRGASSSPIQVDVLMVPDNAAIAKPFASDDLLSNQTAASAAEATDANADVDMDAASVSGSSDTYSADSVPQARRPSLSESEASSTSTDGQREVPTTSIKKKRSASTSSSSSGEQSTHHSKKARINNHATNSSEAGEGSDTAAIKTENPFKIGSRLLALSNSQLVSMLLQLTEKHRLHEEVLQMLPGIDAGELQRELEEALKVLNRTLPPSRSGRQPPRDSATFKKAFAGITLIKTVVNRQSQALIDGSLFKDYCFVYTPLALSAIAKIPLWEDPRNNKPTQQMHKKIASHLRIALPRALNAGDIVAEDLNKLKVQVEGCRDFKEVCEFRGVMEVIKSGLDALLPSF
ncbi:hypothetical protein HDV05_006847 [Chytridiales sp. JEL 0842]|nr:hypothetical protein HDV05_006847 [Chytridiales sp. JEL 0842]